MILLSFEMEVLFIRTEQKACVDTMRSKLSEIFFNELAEMKSSLIKKKSSVDI